MTAVIVGLGTARPLYSIAQPDAARLAEVLCCRTPAQQQLLPMLYERTKIHHRGSVLLEAPTADGPRQSFFPFTAGENDRGPTTQQRMRRYAEASKPLALAASRRALEDARCAGPAITHLVTVSCTGFEAPGVDVALMQQLGLPPTTARVHLGFMGCHGAINGFRVASALAADPRARILLCAVELCSVHFQYGWDPEKIVANALFSDGAAAAVLAPAAPTSEPWRVAATGSCLFPDSSDAMTWRIGDHGFEMTLSPRVPGLVAAHLRPWLESWLTSNDCSLDAVRSWAIHPGGPRILSAVADSLGLSAAAVAVSREILTGCGNMSSTTILFILELLRRRAAPTPCVALAFGPGLVAEAALLF